MATKEADFTDPGMIPSGKGRKFGIVVSDWNSEITNKLLEGAEKILSDNDVSEDDINVVRVPGSYELPMGARILASRDKFDAIICLGCVIKGETRHDEYISSATANGIMQLGLMMNLPVIFGVLTPNNQEQALERAGGKYGNKGGEAAITALRMADLKEETGSSKSKIGFV